MNNTPHTPNVMKNHDQARWARQNANTAASQTKGQAAHGATQFTGPSQDQINATGLALMDELENKMASAAPTPHDQLRHALVTFIDIYTRVTEAELQQAGKWRDQYARAAAVKTITQPHLAAYADRTIKAAYGKVRRQPT